MKTCEDNFNNEYDVLKLTKKAIVAPPQINMFHVSSVKLQKYDMQSLSFFGKIPQQLCHYWPTLAMYTLTLTTSNNYRQIKYDHPSPFFLRLG